MGWCSLCERCIQKHGPNGFLSMGCERHGPSTGMHPNRPPGSSCVGERARGLGCNCSKVLMPLKWSSTAVFLLFLSPWWQGWRPQSTLLVKQALSLRSANSLNKPGKSSVGRGRGNAVYPIPFEYSQEKAEGKKTLRSHLVCPPAPRQRVPSLHLILNEQSEIGWRTFFSHRDLKKCLFSLHVVWSWLTVLRFKRLMYFVDQNHHFHLKIMSDQ